MHEETIKELDSYYKTKVAIETQLNEMQQFKKGKFEMLLNQCQNVSNKKIGNIIKLTQGDDLHFTKEKNTDCNFPAHGCDYFGYVDKFNRESKYVIYKDCISDKCVSYINGKFFLGNHAWTYDLLETNIIDEFIGIYFLNIQSTFYELAKKNSKRNLYQDDFYEISLKIPSKQDQEKIIREMKKEDNLEKMLNDKLEEIDLLIKSCFNCHVNKHISVDKNKNTSINLTENLKNESSNCDFDNNSDNGSDSDDDSDYDSDDNFSDLEIQMKDLEQINVKTKDGCQHYYHKKNNCIYSKSLIENKWFKPDKSLQKQLLNMSKHLNDNLEDKKSKKIKKR